MDGFKQRIIGALVIVCLAVIFLPMLFDEPHEERQSQAVDIPPEPDFPEVRVEEPEAVPEPEVDDSVPTPEATVEEPAEPESTEPDQVAAVDDPPDSGPAEPEYEPEPVESSEEAEKTQPELEGTYLVQLGSFGSGENARALRDRVRDEGLDAYTETISRDDQTLTRVYAGPFMEKSDAEAAKELLDETLGLQTLVVTGG